MKTLIIVLLLGLSTPTIITEDTYCDGFYDGWDSYYENQFMIPPVAPICPLPTVNEQNTYRSGFTRGVIAAKNNHNENE